MSVASALALGFTGFVVYNTEPGTTLFSYHPALMTIAYSLLVFEGIQIFNKSNPIRNLLPIRLMTYHWVMMTLALSCVSGGMFAVYQNKENMGKAHFQTLHSKFGLVSNIALFQVALGGVLAWYRKQWNLSHWFKKLHIAFGALTYLPALGALITGLWSNYFSNAIMKESAGYWKAIYALPIICAFVIVMQVTLKLFFKKKSKKHNVD